MGQNEVTARGSSVAPGINNEFSRAEDLHKLVAHFGRPEREVFQRRQEILQRCELNPQWTVADIGAGTGLFTRLLAEQTRHVYALDLFEHFVDHIRLMGLSNVTALVCDSQSARLPAESIDLAFICNTYHHLEYPDSVLRTIHFALRRDGYLIVVDLHPNTETSDSPGNHVRGDRNLFCHEIESSGFGLISVDESFLKSGYLCRFKKS